MNPTVCLLCNHPLIYHDDMDGCDEMIDTGGDSIAICKCRSTVPCTYCRVVMPGMVILNDGRRVCRACAIAQSDCRKDRS